MLYYISHKPGTGTNAMLKTLEDKELTELWKEGVNGDRSF
jgi:hypothetical protein